MVTLDHETHTYTNEDGVIYDSVTQILSPVMDKTWYTEGSRDRGSAIHEAIFLIEENDITIEAYNGTELYPYIEAYLQFKKESGYEPEKWEQVYFSDTLRLAGTIDTESNDTIVDIKTGALQKWHGIQLAGYHRLNPKKNRNILVLKNNGRYTLHDNYKGKMFTDPEWEKVFNALLTLKRWTAK